MPLNPNLLAAPIVIPLLAASLGLIFAHWGYRRTLQVQRLLTALAVTINLFVAVRLFTYTIGQDQRLVLQAGLWPAPYGITLLADGLSAIMLILTAILAAGIVPYAIGTLDQRERMNFHPLLLFLLMGVNGAFLAGDLFNLYVFFEVLLMASFVLLTLGGQPAQIHGGVRYVVLNLIASFIFLSAVAITYGALGTLNLAHLAERMASVPPGIRNLMAGLLFVAYASKAGLFPLFAWLPASYHTPHPAVTAFFAGVLTKVGIYTLFRIYPLLFPEELLAWQPLILAIAGLTMLTGIFGAMAANTVRRTLSFQVISHVGYIVMGLGLAAGGNPNAAAFGLAAGLLYLAHHMIVKTALLMAGGAAEMEMGTGLLSPGHLGGLLKRRPILAIIFFIAAFSLAGIPPSSGFVSKLGLLQSALTTNHWLIAGVSLLVSVFTLSIMIRLWQKIFTGEATQPLSPKAPLAQMPQRWLTLTPIALLVALSLGIGLFSEPVLRWSTIAANQVLDRTGYIQAVNLSDDLSASTVEN